MIHEMKFIFECNRTRIAGIDQTCRIRCQCIWQHVTGLLHKLCSISIRDIFFLRSSHIFVTGNRGSLATCSWPSVNAGVPQGSIIGPQLFLIYINNIVTYVEAKLQLFADDTSLFAIVDDPESSATLLNRDQKRIYSWSESCMVSYFQSKQNESVLFTRKRHKPTHPIVSMDQNPIKQMKNHKHLNLKFSDAGMWTSYISSSLNKVWQRIGILRSLDFFLERTLSAELFRIFRTYLE